jgi:hypothetical protein
MILLEIIRGLFFIVFGLGFAFMLATNVLAFKVLRPPKKLGFLWWHITSISVSFTLISSVALSRTLDRLSAGATWHTYVTAVGILLYAVAQAIIFNVERERYVIIKSGLMKANLLDEFKA